MAGCSLRHDSEAVLFDQREQLERGAGWPLFAALPLADQTAGHVQVVGKNGLADVFSLADCLDLLLALGEPIHEKLCRRAGKDDRAVALKIKFDATFPEKTASRALALL
jgi:hypothetical protein